ncbi:MAG: hypothetical protein RIR70_2229 [Pseudomonadota bacterium]|jgi:ankyrin repeat protein
MPSVIPPQIGHSEPHACRSLDAAYSPSRLEHTLAEWVAHAPSDEQRAEAARRIKKALAENADSLDLRGLNISYLPINPDDLPAVVKLWLTGNKGMTNQPFNWANKIADLGLFVIEQNSLEAHQMWANLLASAGTPKMMSAGIVANLNLGHRLRMLHADHPERGDYLIDAKKYFATALSLTLSQKKDARLPAQSIMKLLDAGENFVEVHGTPLPRPDLERIARGELPLPEHERRARLARVAALEAVLRQMNAGWGANVHFAGLLSCGALAWSMIQAHNRIEPPDLDDTCRQITAHFANDHEAIDGLSFSLQLDSPIKEGGLNTDIFEVIRHLWAYCQNQTDATLRDNLIAAFATRLRDISQERPCNTGCIQRLLQVPDGIDPRLEKGWPDTASLRAEITTLVSRLDAFLDDKIEAGEAAWHAYQPSDASLPPDDRRHEAIIRFKLQKAEAAIRKSLIDLQGLPDDLVKQASHKPLADLELNELMLADKTIAHLSTEYRDHRGRNALLKALLTGDSKGAIEQIKRGADVNLNAPGYGFPLLIAAQNGQLDAVNALLDCEDIDCNQRNETGWTALMVASWQGKTDVVERLSRQPGIDPNLIQKEGWNALLMATLKNQPRNVSALLSIDGINPNGTLPDGTTALMLAARTGQLEVAKRLLEMPNIDLNQTDHQGLNALMIAARAGHVSIVKALLEKEGIRVNHQEPDGGWTALMMAATNGHVSIVEALLAARNIDPEIQDKLQGANALMFAIEGNHVEVVRLILDKGAIDPKTRNQTGISARRLARDLDHTEIVSLLNTHPAYGKPPGRLGLGQILTLMHAKKSPRH